jgi:outer membrane protein TolC
MSDTQISPSFGLVLRKNLSDGNKLKTEIDLAQRKVFSQEQAIKNQYELLDSQAQELRISIEAFKQKQELNQKNINYTKDEIAFLEKQLTVGQSSLTSIVSAEAQLFELEARSITLKSENYISKLTLLSLLGELDQLIGYKLQPIK